MEGTTIDDPLFGPLTWDRIEHAWLGKARLDEWLDSGSALRDSADGLIRDDFDPQKLLTEGAFRLVVRPGDGVPSQPPQGEQREAWARFLERREPIMADIMDRALSAYVRQRPARIHWWKTMYGADDPLLAEALPEVRTVDELRRLVRPHRFVIWEPRAGEGPPPWIMVHFDAAWDRARGFAARLRDGKVIEFGSHALAETPPGTDPLIDVRPFGRLKCYKGHTWTGAVHFEPFSRMRRMADEREEHAHFRSHPILRPAPDWDFIEGNFDFEVISPREGTIAPEQIEAFTAFMRDPQRSADLVLQAIFDQYQGYVDRFHEEVDPATAEQLMPRIDSPDGLRELITFQTMVISTPLDDNDRPFIGLGFACSWDEEHGLYVRWRDGVVEEVGGVETIM